MDGNTAARPGAGPRRTVAQRNVPHTKRTDVTRKCCHYPGRKDSLAADREAAPWVPAVARGVPPGDVYLTRWYRRISSPPVPGEGPADWACVRVTGT